MELKSNQQCRLILKRFADRPDLAAFVETLIVGPNRSSGWAGLDMSLKEPELAASLEQLASDGRLKRLHSFRWEGVEAPHDRLWWTLKT